jgi:hypothetical protein
MILSFNVLSDGVISSEVYEFNDVVQDVAEQLTQISQTILINSSELTEPNSHLYNYLDGSKFVQFTILDTNISEYLTNTLQINYTKLN